MTRPAATPVPDDARATVDEILAAHTAWRDALRTIANHPRPTGAMADDIFALDDERKKLEEGLRRAYFRRAARVTVDQWGVYTWSPTGRVVRMVWKIEPAHADAM